MINKLILILALTAGSCDPVLAAYSDWSEKEQKQYRFFVALQVVDTAQTLRMVSCQQHDYCNLRERNPLLGERPSAEKVIAFKLIGNVVLYKLLDSPRADTSRALKWMNRMGTIVVVSNGIQWRKQF
jgi:hypothetical protein